MSVGGRRHGALPLLAATSGLIVWSSAFVALYAGLSVGCRTALPGVDIVGVNALSIVLAAVWLAHLAVLGALQRRHWRSARAADGDARFLPALACLVTATGLIATVAVGFAVLILPPCI